MLPVIEPDGDKIWTYFEAMKPAKFPKSLVIMGSGAIGMEFASFYRSLGAEVGHTSARKLIRENYGGCSV